MKIYLNKDIIQDLNYTDMDIAVYIVLRSMHFSEKEEFYISIKMIGYELYGINIPKRALTHIKNSINHLVKLGLFEITSTFGLSEYVIKAKSFHLEKYNPQTQEGSFYIIIEQNEFHQIMNIETGRDKVAILRFFVNVIGSINLQEEVYLRDKTTSKKGVVGYMTQKYLGDLSDINVGVVEDYCRVLEDAEVLYIYRHRKYHFNEFGEIKSLPNHYGRFKDREYIKQYALNYEQRIVCFDSTNSNQKRSLAAKYNCLISDFEKYITKYSDTELIEIFEYIHERNNQIPRKEDGSFLYSEDKKRIKDETIFNRIPCVVEYINKTLNDNCNTFLLDEILNNDDLFETEGVENE